MIVLIGAGAMGCAMLESWCAQGLDLVVLDPNPSPAVQDLAKQKKLQLNAAVQEAEVVVLAVKPDKVDEALNGNKGFLSEGTLLISIAAGVGVAQLSAASGLSFALRAMPNTPAQIGEGFIALYASAACSADHRVRAAQLMAALGEVTFVAEEEQMDALTVLSGCGPAYLFYLAEVLVAAGGELGLDKKLATQAVIKTLSGAAQLLEQSVAGDPKTLRKQVTSLGGVTEAAFDVLLEGGDGGAVQKIFHRAFANALKRAQALKGQK